MPRPMASIQRSRLTPRPRTPAGTSAFNARATACCGYRSFSSSATSLMPFGSSAPRSDAIRAGGCSGDHRVARAGPRTLANWPISRKTCADNWPMRESRQSRPDAGLRQAPDQDVATARRPMPCIPRWRRRRASVPGDDTGASAIELRSGSPHRKFSSSWAASSRRGA
jgi:hypothetical protein